MVTLDQIKAAQARLRGIATRTPLVRYFPPANDKGDEDSVGGPEQLWFKPESLQPIGSFKLRGAYNKVASFSEEERQRGVISYSSGNHAQGVAYAARAMGVKAVIVMPRNAPRLKVDSTAALGAEIVTVGPASTERMQRAEELSRQHGYVIVPPYNDEQIIAGQGTVGLEILEDLPDVDCIVASYGGGGLSCGIAAAMKERKPQVKVFAAEPETAAPLAVSLAAGSPQKFTAWKASWVDGCGGKSVFPRMWGLAHHLLAGSIVRSLEEIRHAMRLVAERNHVIAEGAGACAVAAGLSGKAGPGKIVCVVSGGNIDLAKFSELMSA